MKAMRNLFIIFISVLFFQISHAQEVVKLEGKDAILVRQKTTCGSLEQGKTYYGMWEGRAWSRVPGEKDKHLFNVIGINTRQCKVVQDKVRGYGFKSVSREIMMYMDPETNEIMDVWKNPWNDQEIEVVHVANDPVNMRGTAYEKDKDGNISAKSKFRKYGDILVTSHEIPLFYSNPLGSEYQAYVGGAYHAMEIFNTYYDAKEILDPKVKNITRANLSWSRVAQWLPWMQMGDKPGLMVFNATGFSTLNKDLVWDEIIKITKERYPTYMTPPPLNDDRKNETSWTVFKKFIEGKEKAKVGSH